MDQAIRVAAALKPVKDPPRLVRFFPFDPAQKMSEATATGVGRECVRVIGGAFGAVMASAKKTQHTVGMCVDGANDAPALR